MSGSPGGLQAVPSAAVDPSIGATSCLMETSRGGGRRHPRIPFCSSGLQAGCGRSSPCSTRQTGIQQLASAAQRVPGLARHLGTLAVIVPPGCLQPGGLAQDVVALEPACRAAPSKKRTCKDCQNRTPKDCANTRALGVPVQALAVLGLAGLDRTGLRGWSRRHDLGRGTSHHSGDCRRMTQVLDRRCLGMHSGRVPSRYRAPRVVRGAPSRSGGARRWRRACRPARICGTLDCGPATGDAKSLLEQQPHQSTENMHSGV